MVDEAAVQRCLCLLGTGSIAGFAKAVLEGCSKDTTRLIRYMGSSLTVSSLDLIPTGK